MPLTLTPRETDLLRQLLEGEQARLLREIARADRRSFRELLRQREAILSGILGQLEPSSRGLDSDAIGPSVLTH